MGIGLALLRQVAEYRGTGIYAPGHLRSCRILAVAELFIWIQDFDKTHDSSMA
jgi:hypothetical protein